MENSSLPEDQTIACKTCQKDFFWSAKEQLYYKKKGFTKKPQRCQSCRENTNKLRSNSMFYIHCGICDKDAAMLNPPPKDRVSICSKCFRRLLELAKKPN